MHARRGKIGDVIAPQSAAAGMFESMGTVMP